MLVRTFSLLSFPIFFLLMPSGNLLWVSFSYPLRCVGILSGLKMAGLPLDRTSIISYALV